MEQGGGCVTFVKAGVPYRTVHAGTEMECVATEVWAGRKKLVVFIFTTYVEG